MRSLTEAAGAARSLADAARAARSLADATRAPRSLTDAARAARSLTDGARAIRCLLALSCAAALASACGPGDATTGACKMPLLPGDLVITEVFADFKATTGGTGADAGKEWIEIYNARSEAIDLAGLTITHSRPDGAKATTHVVGAATIAPGQFFTLGNAAQALLPAYVDYGYGDDLGDLFNSGGGKLALACGDRELDSATYDDVTEGRARELTAAQPPEYLLNDSAASWCTASASEFEAGNFGTPGSANDCQPLVLGQCSERGTMRAAVAPGPGDLVITEIMPSPYHAGDATAEWFEAQVMRDVDLNGVGLDRVGEADEPDVLASTDCLRVRAGSHVVFARSADPALNGGLPATAIAGTFRFSMIAGTAAAPGDVAIVAGTTLIDAVRWTASTTGRSRQLDPARGDPSANDAESNFCDATASYGRGDLGTPGAANTPCDALPMTGLCDDGGAPRPIVVPAAGQLVISEVLANPAPVPDPADPTKLLHDDPHREWLEVANTGATAFDLNDLRIGRAGATGTAIQSARCVPVAPGMHAVLARSNDPQLNGGIAEVAATFGFTLVDSDGDVQIAHGADVLDVASWRSVKSGITRQLDPAHLTTADNDDSDGSQRMFCAGAAAYGDGSNLGTPGTANARCPP